MFHALFGVIAFWGIFFIIILIAILLLYTIGLWKVFQKAGRNGWEAIVPFYNTWVLVEISGLAWWYALIIIFSNIIGSTESRDSIGIVLSICSIIAKFFTFYNISKKLHKDTGFAILMTIFPFIMIPLVGFSNNYQFDANVVVSENGPFDQKNEKVSNQESNGNHTNFEHANSKNSDSNHFCPQCGKPLKNGAKFCGNCGNMIK